MESRRSKRGLKGGGLPSAEPDSSLGDWLAVGLPIAGSMLAASAVIVGYRVHRKLRWRAREKREAAWASRPEFHIPGTVKRPADYAAVEPIHAAQHNQLEELPGAQARYYLKGLAVALLPPMALLALAGQVVFFSAGGSWALGLALSETMLLVCLLCLAWSAIEPSGAWVSARVRAELLRREQYLRLVRVGPYAGLDEGSAGALAESRVAELLGTYQLSDLSRLICVDLEPVGNALEPAPLFPNKEQLVRVVSTYLFYRVRKQRMWFGLARVDCNRDERLLGAGLKLALVGGVVAGLAHGLLLGWPEQWPHKMALAGAMTIPAVSGSFAALANLYRFDIRAAFYGRQYQELTHTEQRLHSLLRSMEGTRTGSFEVESRQFQRLAMETERSLARELEEWIAYTYSREFRLG